ncbi:MAG: hypothetical protein HKN44_10485 [Ilumatobacter sp.]|nr:hypothetical protein [Ilumatobacter sp.]
MGMPAWWDERRYGLFLHASLASVPAWAPIGQDASWYRCHLGDDVPAGHLQPMVEVVAHHRDRWGHIEHFDDFLELLSFDHFDADDWARLAVDAGAGYGVIVAKHRDGLCWWDAPDARRSVVDGGPRRNVVAEFAAACERHGVVFGAHYSPTEWGDAAAAARAQRQVADLIGRYGPHLLRTDRDRDDTPRDHTPGDAPGDGAHADESGDRGVGADQLARLHALEPDLVVNDRWWRPGDAGAGPAVVRTLDDMPDDIDTEPWELCRSVARGFGHNRNDRHEHHLSGYDVVTLLTEVVAKGGHLLLGVGPQMDGSIASMQADPIRDAGTWVRAHRELIDRSRPWTTWGDDDVRYVTVDGVLHAIDVTGFGRFAALDPATHRVMSVERLGSAETTSMHFVHGADGLALDLPRSTPWRRSALPLNGAVAVDVAVYRIEVEDVDQPGELFAPVDRPAVELAPLVGDVAAGDIVQLGDGDYCGPATVPPGVILRGLGPGRTRIDGQGGREVRLGRNSRIEHLTITGAARGTTNGNGPAIVIDGQFATLLGCDVAGQVVVRADDALIRASTLTGVRAEHVDRLTLSRCQLRGNRWDVGVHLDGGTDHEVDSCELRNHLCAIRATATTGTVVRGTNIEARWWGVHLERTERAHVHGNRVEATMRAVDVDGGTSALIDGNAVTDGDSGCIVERGASGCRVAGNHWERCRIGLLAWDTTGLEAQDNHVLSLHEPDQELVIGP